MDVILKINNDYSYLVTNKQKIRDLLWKKLRFRKRGYFHTRAYQNGSWDGFSDFFNKKTGRFLTGLLPEVRLVLNSFNIPFETNDTREIVSFLHDSINENFLHSKANPITLYDYQVDLVNNAIKNKRCIIKAPTSAGKTEIMIAIMKALPPKTPILFLANRKSIIVQNYKRMGQWGLQNVGRFYDEYHEPNIITCCSVQSAHHLDKLLPKFKVVIADEIHMLSNNTGFGVFKKLKGASIRIGVSATPFKHGGTDDVQKYALKGYFGQVLKVKEEIVKSGVLTTSFLQDRGTISDSECTFFKVTEPKIPYLIYSDAVTEGLANNHYLNKKIANLSKNLHGRTLILVDRIVHGDTLNKLITNSFWVQGKDNEDTREFVIGKLRDSKTNIVAIATRQIFDTGVNFFVHNIINASGGSATHQIIQLIGRGLRLADDKNKLNYYDFLFQINEYLDDHSINRINVLKKEGYNVKII